MIAGRGFFQLDVAAVPHQHQVDNTPAGRAIAEAQARLQTKLDEATALAETTARRQWMRKDAQP